MKHVVAIGLLLCAAAQGQMQLLQVTGPGAEKELPSVFAMGAVAVGENAIVRVRVRNASQSQLTIRTLVLAGTGFTMIGQPTLPHQIAPGLNMDVEIRFSPRDHGSYSASFSVNGTAVMLTGSSIPAAVLMMAGMQLPSGSAADLGLAQRGATAFKTFRLVNTTPEVVRIQSVRVTGSSFKLPQELSLPLELAPGNSYEFEIAFAPLASGVFQGALMVDDRTYRLTGAANEPAFPKPTIVVDLPVAASAQQGKVSVHFGQASHAIGPGTLRMEFQPLSAMAADDQAVRFTRGSSRSAAFHVTEGTVTPLAEMTFQTGTTAGTIVFTAEVGGWTANATVNIAPQTIQIEKTRAARNGSMLEVEITGFDNTRSVDGVAFTFFNARGEAVQPGAIRVNTAADFRRHFEASGAGGVFALKAVFPVAGAISEIASAETQLTNTAGSTQSGKIQLQ